MTIGKYRIVECLESWKQFYDVWSNSDWRLNRLSDSFHRSVAIAIGLQSCNDQQILEETLSRQRWHFWTHSHLLWSQTNPSLWYGRKAWQVLESQIGPTWVGYRDRSKHSCECQCVAVMTELAQFWIWVWSRWWWLKVVSMENSDGPVAFDICSSWKKNT